LFESKLCNNRDIPFLRAVQQASKEYKEEMTSNVEKGVALTTKLKEKFEEESED